MSWVAPNKTDAFFRIEAKNFRTDEEVRYDVPTSFVSTFLYVGISGLATPTSEASWAVIRTEFDSNTNIVRKQIKIDIAWDNRVSGPWV